MKAQSLFAILLCLLGQIYLTSCADDSLPPLSLHEVENHTIRLYHGTKSGVTISGGEREYTYFCNSPLLKIEMPYPNFLRFESLGIGDAIVVIQDRSGQSYELKVDITYYSENYTIVATDVYIEGDGLTDSQQKLIEQKALNMQLVQPGGLYQFVFTGGINLNTALNNQGPIDGMAVLYPTLGGKEHRLSFEQTAFYADDGLFLRLEYNITSEGRTHTLIPTHLPKGKSDTTVAPGYTSLALIEEVTQEFTADYPQVKEVKLVQYVGRLFE